ncbi:hypothetical protein P8Q44_12200 [Bacillus pumilus]|uniref:hypothetical protein n=1 Tax=Bacillus TaxID=1386 RepID=UPI000D037722|nr:MULTISPECIES: hypothetical protein [Bacillus]MDG4729043.1 hypothetical protein [Bacillus pumilus]PRS74227.1 hypothetical protein C6Y04_14995 [Bacillus sp. GBSW2]
MSLLEFFNQSLKRFEDQKEPITFALAAVIQKKIDESLHKEYEEFDQWFRQTFYSEGKPTHYFRVPLVDESPVIFGGKPKVILLNGPYVSGVSV